jgi:GTP diphosphokinase / guanosine-3',5'-bis(diphosphate) 3'-diphosphatase
VPPKAHLADHCDLHETANRIVAFSPSKFDKIYTKRIIPSMSDLKSISSILDEMQSKSDKEIALVKKAYNFAKNAHSEQKRYSGEPYFLHLAEVGYSLARIGMDAPTIAAGILHDVIEDVNVAPETLEKEFGKEVLNLVEGVTKLGALRYRGMERHTESLRKLFAATAKDIRVLIVKLMDRLHNAITLEHVPKHKRKRIALETLEIYAPIADRLGMGVIKRELEDASFPFAYPKEYIKVTELLKERHAETKKRLEKTEKTLKKELAAADIREFRTDARVKGVYSLFRKLERKELDITKIHDILALRIIVPNVATCYSILGVIHGQWRPVPGKIKDYIAFPKPNGYQSIHTTIYTGDGGTLEIQVRTEAMHREAQFGIASHFSYKEGHSNSKTKKGSGLEWIRQFLPLGGDDSSSKNKHEIFKPQSYRTEEIPGWVKDLADTQSEDRHEKFLEDIKGDFFSHRVFVFTPRGDVIDLPIDASPVDFAYIIHSDIGNHMAGSKVNGKLVSLDTTLHNGDIVEILTKHSSKPTQKWLAYAKTTLAKRHIRSAIQNQKS